MSFVSLLWQFYVKPEISWATIPLRWEPQATCLCISCQRQEQGCNGFRSLELNWLGYFRLNWYSMASRMQSQLDWWVYCYLFMWGSNLSEIRQNLSCRIPCQRQHEVSAKAAGDPTVRFFMAWIVQTGIQVTTPSMFHDAFPNSCLASVNSQSISLFLVSCSSWEHRSEP